MIARVVLALVALAILPKALGQILDHIHHLAGVNSTAPSTLRATGLATATAATLAATGLARATLARALSSLSTLLLEERLQELHQSLWTELLPILSTQRILSRRSLAQGTGPTQGTGTTQRIARAQRTALSAQRTQTGVDSTYVESHLLFLRSFSLS